MVGFAYGEYLPKRDQQISLFFGIFVVVPIYSTSPFAEPPVEKDDLLRKGVRLLCCKDFGLTDSACS